MLSKAANDWLRETWLELRNGNSYPRRVYFNGGADALKDVGLLTGKERDAWVDRVLSCPGHDGESGRGWCAYGCALPAEAAS